MRWLYLASVCLHILAAMTWIGGMVILVAAVMPWVRGLDEPNRKAFLDAFGRRFRAVAWTCYGVLAITGTLNLWMRGVRPSDLLRSDWRASLFGQVVIVKLSLFLLVVLVTTVHEHIVARWQARWLGRLSLAIGLAIVAVAIVLVRGL